MDERDRIINDWLTGNEIDPIEYDPYILEQLRQEYENEK